MTRQARIPAPMEMEVVAMLARGDTQVSIRDVIEEKYGRRLSAGVFSYIKKRYQTIAL